MGTANLRPARLVERVDYTHDLAVFRFRPEAPPTFRPGQYATLALADGDHLIQRAYSIVSSPHETDLEFIVELVPEGELTPRLWEMKVGDEVLIRPKIVGRFTLDPSDVYTHHLMLATVTGIAPYLSMARYQQHCLARDGGPAVPMVILLGASYSAELRPYHDELAELARTDWLHYIPTVSRPGEDAAWTGEVGRVEDIVRKYADTLRCEASHTVGYACGHPQMIENARSLLTRARFGKDQFKEEKYFVP